MPRFDRSQQDALKDYLYRSDIHDARIETYGLIGREKFFQSMQQIRSLRLGSTSLLKMCKPYALSAAVGRETAKRSFR